jgi:predicted helicase
VPGRVTVLCTYQSLGMLAAAHARHGLPGWDLVIVDEAHRTAGRAGKAWAVIYDTLAHEVGHLRGWSRRAFTVLPGVRNAGG